MSRATKTLPTLPGVRVLVFSTSQAYAPLA